MTVLTGWYAEVDGEPATLSAPVQTVAGTVLTVAIAVNGVPVQEGQVVRVWYNDDNDENTTDAADDIGTIVASDGGEVLANITNHVVSNASTIEIPELTAGTVDTAGNEITLTFSRALSQTSVLGFSVDSSGDNVVLRSIVLANNGLSATLFVDAVYSGATVTIDYDPSTGDSVGLASGDELAAVSLVLTNSSTREPPTVTYAIAATTGAGVDIRFSERITSANPDLGWTVTDITDSNNVLSITSASIVSVYDTDDTIRLVLTEPLYTGRTIELAYDAGAGDVLSFANNLIEVASFTGAHVVNNSALALLRMLESSTLAADGVSLTLVFNASLTGSASLGFTVYVDGEAVALTGGGSLVGDTITRTLTDPAYEGATVTVSYDAGSGTLASGFRTMPSFTLQGVTNLSEVVAYDPADLFALSENGWYFEPTRSGGAFVDNARVTPATVADNEPAGCLADLSGNGYHLESRDGAGAHALVTPNSSIGFRTNTNTNTVLFTATGIAGANLISLVAPPTVFNSDGEWTRYALFAVYGDPGATAVAGVSLIENSGSAAAGFFSPQTWRPVASTLVAGLYGRGTTGIYNTLFYSAVAPQQKLLYLKQTMSGGVMTLRIRDGNVDTTVTLDPFANGSGYLISPSLRLRINCTAMGSIAFDLGINRLLTGPEETDIEAYLAARYPSWEL